MSIESNEKEKPAVVLDHSVLESLQKDSVHVAEPIKLGHLDASSISAKQGNIELTNPYPLGIHCWPNGESQPGINCLPFPGEIKDPGFIIKPQPGELKDPGFYVKPSNVERNIDPGFIVNPGNSWIDEQKGTKVIAL